MINVIIIQAFVYNQFYGFGVQLLCCSIKEMNFEFL